MLDLYTNQEGNRYYCDVGNCLIATQALRRTQMNHHLYTAHPELDFHSGTQKWLCPRSVAREAAGITCSCCAGKPASQSAGFVHGEGSKLLKQLVSCSVHEPLCLHV